MRVGVAGCGYWGSKHIRVLQSMSEVDLVVHDLSIIARERSQSSGGRLDFLMFDPEEEGVRYEVEVMLGRLDESHIIRAIEY